MKKGKAFAVVGHKHWGKSKTLLLLTNGRKRLHFEFKGKPFAIKRMSNDDVPKGFFEWINELQPDRTPFVIIALCPTFLDEKKKAQLVTALRKFRKKYDLFFFVLQHKYGVQGKQIQKQEIASLEEFGRVKIFVKRNAEAKTRAAAFKRLIFAHV